MTQAAASDPPGPPNTQEIAVHVAELKQLFHSLDPTPFRERDLDPKAEEFIAEWARELHGRATLALVIHLDRQDATDEDVTIVRDAIRDYFAARAESIRRRLRQLLRVGRTSLVIGLVFLSAMILAGDLANESLRDTQFGTVVREGLLIGGWVAMWRPIEIFLYDWWPIRYEARLYDRLSAMDVRLVQSNPAAR